MTNEDIVAACKKHFTAYSGDCSGFVHAVTTELGHTVSGNADGQMRELAGSPDWQSIDRAAAVEAVKTGALVVAGLKGIDHNPARNHGHIVIVVDGELYHNTYPLCWCGSLGGSAGRSKGTKSVGEVWNRADR